MRVAVLYFLLCAAYLLRQQGYLFPGQGTHGEPYTIVTPSSNYELVQFISAHGRRIRAIFGQALDKQGSPRSDAPSCPTILYFNGNAATVSSSLDVFRGLRKLGCNLLIPDYPGYGMSDGYPSEHTFYECADSAYAYLCGRPDVDRSRIISAGWSLGGAVAIDLAAHRPVCGLIVLSAFSSLPAVAHDPGYWWPASVWLRASFDNKTKIALVRCPVLIASGRHDELIPSYMSEQLARAGGVPAPLEIDSGHDVFKSDQSFNAIGRFVATCMQGRQTFK